MKKISQNAIGVVTALLAVFLFSSKAILVKLIYEFEVPTIHILLLRMLFALPFYTGILWFQRKKTRQKVTRKHYAWLLVFGVMGYYLASFFDFYGLKYLTASLERIILFVYPTLVVLIGALFLKTKITKQQAIAIVITYLGVFLTFASELQIHHDRHLFVGVGLIFMSALTYASYLVGSGWLIPKFGTVRFTSIAMIVACVSVLVHYLFTDRISILNYSKEVYLYALVMAFFCTVLPSYLVSFAIQKLGASKFSIIGSVGPVFTILVAALVLGERITFVQAIGVVVVIIGVRVVSKKEKNG
ncbi:DMT family transporter [Wenyingzhuangia sp. 2_MG-2023]|uniref:DMT family transporter n=1 Tax=Wenyingzhuangia sp. 2_MG-2023 TaxID=3062639 RepID=UPI0026E354EA|nr:DMT family transporter [Wenyingzhuangia sp. 2_MG-2023]MDO6738006.1 DMT family transporter [Wenyingzhuangia sp. 2_MG-2023]MDO6802640.1 DMT family transporter [Wenyingzhuangia sp. 1_MG-2023]